jgi:hypothetical protein
VLLLLLPMCYYLHSHEEKKQDAHSFPHAVLYGVL